MEKTVQLESIEFTDYSKYPLEQISGKAGTFQRVIARADDGVGIVHIVEWDPGIRTTPFEVQCHKYWEYVFILDGAMTDLTLDQTFGKGSVAVRRPGMKHGPWQISEEGCKIFEIKSMNAL